MTKNRVQPKKTARATADAGRSRQRSTSRRQRSPLMVIVPVVIAVVIGLGSVFFFFGNDSGSSNSNGLSNAETASLLSDVSWPPYVSRGGPVVKEAYQFAVLRRDVLEYMPCFCGCVQDGHRSNKDCFIADYRSGGSTIVFDNHGSA